MAGSIASTQNSSRAARWGGAALIIVVCLIAYWPAIRGGFIFDDEVVITHNKIIQASDGLYRIWFTSQPLDYWPVTNTVFWLEWRLFHLDPFGYHVVDLFLHVVNVLLAWQVLRKLNVPGAFLAALLWAVHPVNVQSVAWIVELKNTLSMFFVLTSALCYLDGKKSARWFGAAVILYLLAMLSKGSAATLPLFLLLIAWWQMGRITRSEVLRLVPFFAIAVLLTLVDVWFQTHGSGEVIRHVTYAQRIAGAGWAIAFYLWKDLLPVNLAFIYPQWQFKNDVLQWIPLAAEIGVTIFLWLMRGRWWGRATLFAWAFYCIALLPVLGFVDTYYMKYTLVADEYQYVALLGFTSLLAAGCVVCGRALSEIGRWIVYSAAGAAVALLMVGTMLQSALYRDAITIYTDTLNKNPDCWVIHYDLGNALDSLGHQQEAIEHYARCLQLNPDYAEAHNNLGDTLSNVGRTEEAIEQFNKALELKPSWVSDVHCALGITLTDVGRRPEAVEHFEEAIRLKPGSAEYHYDFGNALMKMGRTDEAREQYEQAIKLNADFADAHYKLGIALAAENQLAPAVEQYHRALELKSSSAADIHAALGIALARLGRTHEAVAQDQQALQLNPDNADVHFNLANALFKLGNMQAAISQYQAAVQLKPGFAEAYNGIGAALLMSSHPQQAVADFEQALRLKPDYLDAAANLAHAYAQSNRVDDAIAMGQKSVSLARAAGRNDVAQQIEAWLTKYQDEVRH